jgi:hypothetical protein
MNNKPHKFNKVIKKNKHSAILIVKWGIIYSISLLLGSYILNQLGVTSSFLNLIFTALFVSIVAQAVKTNKNHKFRLKWFLFYYLIYVNIIWVTREFIFSGTAFQTEILLSSIATGFIIALVIAVIQKLQLRENSISWISFILIVLLLAANSDNLNFTGLQSFINSTSETSEEKQMCPTLISPMPNIGSTADFTSHNIGSKSIARIDTLVWRIESDALSCYEGKYRGQHPDWYYCDNMIISRWDTSGSGTINYRLYTAVSSEWEHTNGKYVFNGFNCENGQKVIVDKDTTNYYVHVTRDGTELRIEY